MILLAHFTGLPHDPESLNAIQYTFYVIAAVFSYAVAAWKDNRNNRNKKGK